MPPPRIANNSKGFGGFTLAEVLITLTILGVVAAISISSITSFYKKTMTIARLKVAYSMLDNLTQQSYIENGYPPTGMTMNKSNFDKYFGQYLNISKECGSVHGGYGHINTGCFKAGTYRASNDATENVKDGNGNERTRDMFYDLDGKDMAQSGYTPDNYYKVILKNGMSLGVGNLYAYAFGFQIVVDIDGPNKGNSKLGQDVFQFTYYAPELMKGDTSLVGGVPKVEYFNACKYHGILMGAYRPGNNADCQIARSELAKNCKKNGEKNGNAYLNGAGCSGLIIKDGWKISSDYPWGYAHKK